MKRIHLIALVALLSVGACNVDAVDVAVTAQAPEGGLAQARIMELCHSASELRKLGEKVEDIEEFMYYTRMSNPERAVFWACFGEDK